MHWFCFCYIRYEFKHMFLVFVDNNNNTTYYSSIRTLQPFTLSYVCFRGLNCGYKTYTWRCRGSACSYFHRAQLADCFSLINDSHHCSWNKSNFIHLFFIFLHCLPVSMAISTRFVSHGKHSIKPVSDASISINAFLGSTTGIDMKCGRKCWVTPTYTYPADYLPQSHQYFHCLRAHTEPCTQKPLP